jgi:hypothetical protein
MNDQSQQEVQQASDVPAQPGLRFLETTVYIMGGLLVLMLVGLIGGIIWKASTRTEPPHEGPRVVGAGLAPGTAIEDMALDGDRLAIRTTNEIVVIDTRKGSVVSRIQLHSP